MLCPGEYESENKNYEEQGDFIVFGDMAVPDFGLGTAGGG